MSVSVIAIAPRATEPALDPQTPALMTLLEQLRDVLTLMPASVYRARPAARVSGSIGEHVRHTLDHVAALVACLDGEVLCYDHRVRGSLTETDPPTAINDIERLLYRLDRLPAATLARSVTLSVLPDKHGAPVPVRTTIGRELAYVIQHTIHHCALIAVLLDCQGWSVPAGFGVAPSTARARAAWS